MRFPYELGSTSNIGFCSKRGQFEYQILLQIWPNWFELGNFRASDITPLVGHKLPLQSESDISTSTSTGTLTFWICISHVCPRDFSRLLDESETELSESESELHIEQPPYSINQNLNLQIWTHISPPNQNPCAHGFTAWFTKHWRLHIRLISPLHDNHTISASLYESVSIPLLWQNKG